MRAVSNSTDAAAADAASVLDVNLIRHAFSGCVRKIIIKSKAHIRPDKTRQEAAWYTYMIDSHGLLPGRLLKREVGNEMNRSKELSSLSSIVGQAIPSHGCTVSKVQLLAPTAHVGFKADP